VSLGGFETDILFPGERVHTRQFSRSLSVGRAIDPRLSLQVGVSEIAGGEVAEGEVRGGWAASAGGSWLVLFERRERPFLVLTATASASSVRATADDGRIRTWTAGDARLGALAGKTFGTFVPYVAVRAFGGPVDWRLAGANALGTDRYHYSAGAGLTVRLDGGADLTVEAMPLGERSAVAGVTVHR